MGFKTRLDAFARATQSILQVEELGFSPFVAGFSHLKRALRHFKPVNGRSLCAALLAFRAVIKQIDRACRQRANEGGFHRPPSLLLIPAPASHGAQLWVGEAFVS